MTIVLWQIDVYDRVVLRREGWRVWLERQHFFVSVSPGGGVRWRKVGWL